MSALLDQLRAKFEAQQTPPTAKKKTTAKKATAKKKATATSETREYSDLVAVIGHDIEGREYRLRFDEKKTRLFLSWGANKTGKRRQDATWATRLPQDIESLTLQEAIEHRVNTLDLSRRPSPASADAWPTLSRLADGSDAPYGDWLDPALRAPEPEPEPEPEVEPAVNARASELMRQWMDEQEKAFLDEPEVEPEPEPEPQIEPEAHVAPAEGISPAPPIVDALGRDLRPSQVIPDWTSTGGDAWDISAYMQYAQGRLVGKGALEAWALLMCACVARQNVLLTGLAGSGKSMIARMFAQVLRGATYGSCQMSPSTPAEVVLGPFSLRGLDHDLMARNFASTPLARHVVFLDEIEKAGEHVQQALFSLLNPTERMIIDSGREFDFGGIESLIATRNYELDDPAFADRFSACIQMQDEARSAPESFLDNFFEMHEGERAPAPSYSSQTITSLRQRARHMSDAWRAERRANSALWGDYQDALQRIQKEFQGVISGRKMLNLHKLICAWGAMQSRDLPIPQASDLWALQYGFIDSAEQVGIRAILSTMLGVSQQIESPLFPWPLTSGPCPQTQAQYRSDAERMLANARGRS